MRHQSRYSQSKRQQNQNQNQNRSEGTRSYGDDMQSGFGSDNDFESRNESDGGFSSQGNYGHQMGGRGTYGNQFGESYNQDNFGRDNFGRQGTMASGQNWSGSQSYGTENYSNQNQNLQSHSGKGPKGYKRSDERIREEVCEILEHDHHIDASEIDVTVKEGVVTLSGTVDSRSAKRHAEDLAEHARGVKDVTNQLQVQSSSAAQSGFSGRAAGTTASNQLDRDEDRSNGKTRRQ